jgi:hypothetical protein
MAALPFSVEERNRIREHLIGKARKDSRIVSGASIGSNVSGRGDRWSDLDLTFGVVDAAALPGVLTDWTEFVKSEFGGVDLFDVTDRTTVYRVFLLPGNLQVDLSFTPGGAAQYGPRFALLFGTQVKQDYAPSVPARELFGLGVHHAVRARYSLERGRPWQAEYWINGVREQALSLACHKRGIAAGHGRGFDQLPEKTLRDARATLIASLDYDEMLRALGRAVDLLLVEADEVREFADRLRPQLEMIAAPEWR